MLARDGRGSSLSGDCLSRQITHRFSGPVCSTLQLICQAASPPLLA